MRVELVVCISMAGFAISTPASASGIQDICKAEVTKSKTAVDADYAQWIDAIKDLPPEIKESYTKIFDYNKAGAYTEADNKGAECDKKYIFPQMIVDSVVLYYTRGLALVLPERMTHIDVSEIMSGHPLGGPNAAIPKFREQVLSKIGAGGNGTVANVIRDPWNCVTFRHKC